MKCSKCKNNNYVYSIRKNYVKIVCMTCGRALQTSKSNVMIASRKIVSFILNISPLNNTIGFLHPHNSNFLWSIKAIRQHLLHHKTFPNMYQLDDFLMDD